MIKQKYIVNDFEIKEISNGDVTIEGFANKNVVDDVNDRVIPSGVILTRFEKNPVILFNHDHDKIIGQATDWKATDAGFWIKAKISKSKDAMVSYVRDLIEEGILKTFSIGFQELQSTKGADGANEITSWKLHEVSVVSLPCNIDSEFSLAKMKSIELGNKYREVRKSMKIKGERVANLLAESISSLDDAAKIQLMTEIAAASGEGATPEQVAAVFQGGGEASEAILKAIAEKLNLDLAALMAAYQEDNEPEDEEMPPTEPPKACAPEEDPKKPKTDEEKTAFQDCVSAKIPELLKEGKDQAEAVAIAMQMCQESGKCFIMNDEEKKEMTAFCEKIALAQQTVPTNPMPDMNNPSAGMNPTIEILQQQLNLLTEIHNAIRLLTEEIRADRASDANEQVAQPTQPDVSLPPTQEQPKALDPEIEATRKEFLAAAEIQKRVQNLFNELGY